MTVANKLIVLKLNKWWQPIGYGLVWKAIDDLAGGINSLALDIQYAMDDNGDPDFSKVVAMIPCTWEEWIKLPIRQWDLSISSPSITIRVPTVLIAKNFDKMPLRVFKGKPKFNHVWERDNGIDQYTGKKLKKEEASIDHVVPKSRGGDNSWHNVVLTHKDINWKKGNRTNNEAGLQLIRQPFTPKPIPIMSLITEPKHVDWKHFLVK
jgi:5-methylcytosine-specific restriction endonuclease McrA